MLSCMVRKVCKILNIWTISKLHSRGIVDSKALHLIKQNMKMSAANVNNVRWAFNASTWQPTQEEILLASSCIQLEEKQRIRKFFFREDAKSSLIGRLMMRKYVHLSSGIPYEEIKFGRDGHGKPYLMGAGDMALSFNVSHQGDYVVLAGNVNCNIGIDVMKIEPPVNKDIPDFFRLMKKQFSDKEWSTILSYESEMEQISCFYRTWCLKESYVKNTGFGITVPLQEISFVVKSLKLEVGKFVTDTKLYVRGALKENWVFEETLLDHNHAVAVSIEGGDSTDLTTEEYNFLTIQDVIREAKAVNESDPIFTNEFMNKKLKSDICTL